MLLELAEDLGQLGDEGADGLAEEASAGPRPSVRVRHASLESDPSRGPILPFAGRSSEGVASSAAWSPGRSGASSTKAATVSTNHSGSSSWGA